MASRHLSRSLVLQTLFESDIKDALSLENARGILERNLTDSVYSDADGSFAEILLRGIIGKQPEVDHIIAKAAPQWPIDKIAPIDRNVLRIGLYELLFGDQQAVPPKVALNEAIELAKSFGGDSSGKFVNGVLGAVYREMGEPGKADAPKNPQPMAHEHLGGVVLTAAKDGKVFVALVHDAFGRWTLPKTKCRAGEMTDAAAKRAMEDELGVAGTMKAPLGEHEFVAHEPGYGRVARTVAYFLAVMPKTKDLKCKICEGITDAKWFAEDGMGAIPMYDDLKHIIEAGIKASKMV
jgi:N utilization substance protein B